MSKFKTEQERKEHYKQYEKNRYLKDKLNGGNNRELNPQKRGEIIECECGAKITRGSKSRHEETIKHKNYLDNGITTTSKTPESTSKEKNRN